ncbi:TetR/AcrR family transcriptional regulator [Cumulibacter soli]|uniref:TetR/AcrR family transcriptional regulator n=1 Tax=Cumulibacter soli TaxID=2546344 RepID=UPI001068CB0A|nr:TetR/AcrR family transcriptional regulator [Cumulibacter soli]
MTGVREQHRAETTANILAAAREQVAAHGAALSMRAVARDVGIVSSAIHRYFPTKETLITAMIIESYGRLAKELATAPEDWAALSHALRAWALRSPNEFQLIYGTPLPGYVAPPETVPAAADVARHFLAAGARARVAGFDASELTAQTATLVDQGFAHDPSGAAAVLAELAALTGLISLELGGHLVGTADPADALYAALIARQCGTLGLT